jgi:dipeptidyl aminopeptidase/acylaminoacyl peptidase
MKASRIMQNKARRSLAAAAVVLVAVSGCRDTAAPDPIDSALPPLEAVSFDALDGARIAFLRVRLQGGSGVMVVDGAARTSTQLPHESDPALSADGSRIAFVRLTDLRTLVDTYVMDVGTRSERRISSLEGQEHAPAWSGDNVIFHVHPPTLFARIYRVAAAGGSPVLVWEGTEATLNQEPEGRISTDATGTMTYTNQQRSLFVLDPGATQPTLIYTAPAATRLFSPVWSPDGSRIAFLEILYDNQAGGTRAETRIRTVGRTGGDLRTVVAMGPGGSPEMGGITTQHTVCWLSPSRLAFTFGGGGTAPFPVSSIYTVSVADGSVTRFTTADSMTDVAVSCGRS